MKHILLILSIGICITCTQEQIDSRPYPRLTTTTVTDINASGATFNGEVTYMNMPVTDHGFIWSLYESPDFKNSDSVSLGPITSTGSFSSPVTRSLIPKVQYYVRGYLRTANFLVYGDVISFASRGSNEPALLKLVPPNHLMPGGKMSVHYGNLNEQIKVKFNGVIVPSASVTKITERDFVLQVPDNPRDKNDISVVLDGKEIPAEQKMSAALSQVVKRTVGVNSNKSAFNVGKKVYVGLAADSAFTFNPKSNKFAFVGKKLIPTRSQYFGFGIDGVGYFGGGQGLRDFYSIDTTTNQVTHLPDMIDGTTVAMFTINNKGYSLNLKQSYPVVNSDLYEFDPVSKSWTKKSDVPTNFSVTIATFEANGLLYVVKGISNEYSGTVELWSYNPVSDVWVKVSNPDLNTNHRFGVVNANDKIYLVTTVINSADGKYVSSIREFDPATQKFLPATFSTTIVLDIEGVFSTTGAGYIFSHSYLWKFDPKL